MRTFDVELWEGNERVVYRVNANSPEEAEQVANAKREEVWREQTTREGLEAERAQTEAALEKTGTGAGIVAGLKQSGANIASGLADSTLAITQGFTDIAAFAGSEAAQRASESLQEQRQSVRSFNEDVTVAAYEAAAGRQLTDAEREKAVADAEKDMAIAKTAAEIGMTAGAGGIALRASTAPRMLLVGTAEGALSGWLLGGSADDQKQREAERLGTAAFGSVVGLGASLIPGAFAGAKNWMIRAINRAGGGDIRSKQIALQEAGISAPVTVGQITGDPTLLAAEAQAAGAQADALFREQQQQVAQNLANRIGVQLPPLSDMTAGSRAIVREGIERTSAALGKLRGDRNRAFEQGLDQLEDMVGGQPVMRFDNVAKVTNDLLDGIQTNYRNVSFSKNFGTLLKDLDQAVTVGVSPKQANSILLRLNQIKKSGSGIFNESDEVVAGSIDMYKGHAQKIAASIKASVEEGFDATADRLGGEAGALLKGLRQQYGNASREISVIEDELMGALGLKGGADDILRRLGNADDEAVASAMQALRRLPGGYDFQQKLLGAVYRQAVQDGSAAALGFADKAGSFNLRAFVQSLGKNTEASKLKGMITPQQEANLVKGMTAIRTLLNDPRQASSTGVLKTFLPVDLQGIAINALSRDPGFMARLVAQGIQRGKGAENLFYTKEGIDMLTGATKSIVTGKWSGRIGGATIALLASMLGGGIAEEKGQEIIEAMEQQQ